MLISDLLASTPPRSTIAFTDGSCLGNPGPCGAGAAIFLPDSNEEVELTRPVSARGSILIAELVARGETVHRGSRFTAVYKDLRFTVRGHQYSVRFDGFLSYTTTLFKSEVRKAISITWIVRHL